jgi:hypothetical protein
VDELHRNGFEPTAEGAIESLRQLVPSGDQAKRLAELIKNLGDDSFETRERAQAELLRMGVRSTQALQRASRSTDEEVRARAMAILEKLDGNQAATLNFAALRILEKGKTAGATQVILDAIPHFKAQHVHVAAKKALGAVSTRTELALLTRALQHENIHVRAASVTAMAGLIDPARSKLLRPLLNDKSSQVRYAAAYAVASLGDSACLRTLIDLLEVDDAGMRRKSHVLLRTITGQDIEFASHGNDDLRARGIAKWREWLKDNGRHWTRPPGEIQVTEQVVLPSGLRYTILTPGGGRHPKPTSQVSVHYNGLLLNGVEFDSSRKRGKPARFAVNAVIKGWAEALPLMREGATWRLVIPPNLAYGERGVANTIPPNATLVFVVDLIKVH